MKLVLIFIFLIQTANAATPIKRKLLALYDSTELEGGHYENSYMHKKAEVVFNHYGLKLVYHDIGKGIPKKLYNKTYLSQFIGLATWFTDNKLKNPQAYGAWLEERLKSGLKFVLLGRIGFLRDEKDNIQPSPVINRAFQHLGIKYSPIFYDNPLLLKLEKKSDKNLIEFERELENEVFEALKVENKSNRNTVHLSIKITGEKEEADVVISGENFLYAQYGYDIFEHPSTYVSSWRVNPFHFISKIFIGEKNPIPDTTTLCGRRMAYSHIDGDGFINISNMDRKTLSGKVILDRIINKFKIPTTASIVVAEISPNLLGSRQAVKTSREIFKAKYVEPASHTYSHPLSWNKVATREEAEIYLGKKKAKKHEGQILAYKIDDYKLDYKMETLGSFKYINSELAPISNKAKVILWSGSCFPPKEALKYATDAGYLNMNGGDSRMDAIYPGYSNLSPLYRQVEEYLQVYTSNANENLYTNLWTGPFSGFRDVIDTFKNTEEPRRIKPMNIYYHFYSGEHISSVKSLEEVYEFVLSQNPALVYASDYIKWVHGYHSAKVNQFNRLRYDISDYGHLRTFRIEDTKMIPDYQQSKNIIGHKHHQGNLYIFLGNAKKAHLKLMEGEPNAPYISSCNGWVEQFDLKKNRVKIKGFSRSSFQLEITKPDKTMAVHNEDGLGYFEKSIKI